MLGWLSSKSNVCLRSVHLFYLFQSPLFYPLNSQDIDAIESTLKWDDQFFEMDQLYNSSSDDDIQHLPDNSNHFLRVILFIKSIVSGKP